MVTARLGAKVSASPVWSHANRRDWTTSGIRPVLTRRSVWPAPRLSNSKRSGETLSLVRRAVGAGVG
jgi:hypothetical protein